MLDNEHDANAVSVHNLAGEKVGYVECDVARVLAPLLDEKSLSAVIVAADIMWVGHSKMAARLVVSGPSELAHQVQAQFRNGGCTLRTFYF